MRNYIRLEKKYERRVRGVFEDLSSTQFLERCLKGQTQNRNEGLHSKLWLHCPKVKFAGIDRVMFACQLTIMEHNFGYEATKFMEYLGLPSTKEASITLQKMDKRKVSPRQNKKRLRVKETKSADYRPGYFNCM